MADKIDWENMDASQLKVCQIGDVSCESCAG